MIPRKIEKQLRELAAMYPVVTIVGPRQSGKTTLARSVFSGYQYVSLENFDVREMAEKDPKAFLKTFAAPVIFDEIQRVPQLLSYIQTIVDEEKKTGQYILTGSHQPLLGQSVTQSLAGRTGILQLLPLSLEELSLAGVALTRDQCLYQGFMPRLYDTMLDAKNLYRDYFATYVERDLRLLMNIRELHSFETFIKLLAGWVGQLLNVSSLAGDVGVSSATINQWLSVLEASFIIFRLPCYYENFGKRMVKSQKVYFTEVGLVSWLLGITSPEQAARDPLFGNIFENMVVMEALKYRLNAGETPELYFLRDSKGLEVDLVIRKSHEKLIPVEIKGGTTWNREFAKNLRKLPSLSPKFTPGYVIYSGDVTGTVDDVRYLNFKDTAAIFEA